MITNTERNAAVASNDRAVVKSTPATTSSVSSVRQATPRRAAPSQAIIAQKAYEIWLARGQEQGCDQKHWLEAESQLQHA
jgi:hypothetical protein